MEITSTGDAISCMMKIMIPIFLFALAFVILIKGGSK